VERPRQLISSKSNLVWQKFLINNNNNLFRITTFYFYQYNIHGAAPSLTSPHDEAMAKAAGSRRSLPPPSSARWSSLVGGAELGVGVDLDGNERWGTVGKKGGGRREKKNANSILPLSHKKNCHFRIFFFHFYLFAAFCTYFFLLIKIRQSFCRPFKKSTCFQFPLDYINQIINISRTCFNLLHVFRLQCNIICLQLL
jgi:hypothetical protein